MPIPSSSRSHNAKTASLDTPKSRTPSAERSRRADRSAAPSPQSFSHRTLPRDRVSSVHPTTPPDLTNQDLQTGHPQSLQSSDNQSDRPVSTRSGASSTEIPIQGPQSPGSTEQLPEHFVPNQPNHSHYHSTETLQPSKEAENSDELDPSTEKSAMSSDQDASIASDQEQLDDRLNDEDARGLFGSGSEDEGSGADSISNKRRKLDDEDLDSGDDEGRRDRLGDGAEGAGKGSELYERRANILATSIGRHPGPRPSDGELYLLQLPNFIGIDPKGFTLKSFQPPKTDHHSSGPPSATFSAYHTSNNTLRWRHTPNHPSAIQSNARVLRWSDGSLTLQLASNPREQFELAAKPLAPSQTNPAKATPTSVKPSRPHDSAGYNARLDSHTYLAAPHESAELIRLTNHITASLAVQSSTDQDDEALARLQEQLAAAQKGSKTTQDGGVAVINISEDPEMAKKRAELAEKEKSKMQRRMQIQADRETNRNNNVLKRSGLRTGLGAGLTIGGLEDDDGMATTRGRPSKPKSRRSRRRNSEYSDDEEFRGRGRTREDEYDEDDGFLVGSDEEPEVGEESEEEAEMGDDGTDEEVDKPKKRGSEEAAGGGRAKRRRVIEDEEED